MTNPHRSEIEVTLGEDTYVIRPTFEAIAEIEAALNMGLLPLIRRIAAQEYSETMIGRVLDIAIRRSNPGHKFRDLPKRVFESGGSIKFAPIVLRYLGNAFPEDGGGEQDAEGNL